MTRKRYALEKGGPKRLELSWGSFWRKWANFTLRFDDTVIATIPGAVELKLGQTIRLPDGSVLSVRLATSWGAWWGFSELELQRNNRPLPGTASIPIQQLRKASLAMLFIAVMNVAIGALQMVPQTETQANTASGWLSIAYGVVFGLLWLLVRRRSKIALFVAFGLFGLDSAAYLLFSVIAMPAGSTTPPLWSLLIRGSLLLAMFRGFSAINALNTEDTVLKMNNGNAAPLPDRVD